MNSDALGHVSMFLAAFVTLGTTVFHWRASRNHLNGSAIQAAHVSGAMRSGLLGVLILGVAIYQATQ